MAHLMFHRKEALKLASIYPTYKLPTLVAPGTTVEQEGYKPSLFFDYDVGDFVMDGAHRPVEGTGRDAFEQWCLKQCVTERYTKLGYSNAIGVELVAAVKAGDIFAVKSAIARTITEALMVNPATEYVRNFRFSWSGTDELKVTFEVKGKEWLDASTLTVRYG